MKCNYDTLLAKVGLNKLDKRVEATLDVMTDLPDCRTLKTKKYVSVTPTEEGATATPVFNRFLVPENQFECMRYGCVNSGTLIAGVAGEAVFRANFDMVDYAAGVIAFYVTDIAQATTAITVKISSSANFDNADVYTINKSALISGKDGFYPVVVDLSKAPTSTVGDGWTASRIGAYVSISTDATMGISSITFLESMEDFETSSVVKIGCLTELGTDFEIEAAEATCLMHGYDTSTDPTIERTITGNMVTPNYWRLNPYIGKGKATQGFIPSYAEMRIEEDGNYGTVKLTDMNQDECGFLTVAINDACNVFDSQMYRLTVPSLIDVDETHYFVINNDDGTTTLYFNKTLAGNTVVVSYPKLVEVEEQVGSVANIGKTRVRYTETVTYSDGTQEVVVFDNVLVTSFPFTINEDETEFSFTINIQKGKDGHFMRKWRVLE